MKGHKNSNHLVIENPKYTISNTDNYNQNIHNSIHDILTKFVSSLSEYLTIILEKIHNKKSDCYKFIIERGIDTVSHVFSIILYYTKNLDIAFYHSQKAYYFYIEFIEQISDDNITFLQLSSRDATTFVYKKTIYEISNDYKKTMNELTNEDKSILKYVDTYISIYKNMFYMFTKNMLNQNIATNATNATNASNNQLQDFLSSIIKINNLDTNKNKIKQGQLECIYLFTNLLAYKQKNMLIFFTILEQFMSHFLSKKKQLDDKQIRQNMYIYFDDEIELDKIFFIQQ